MPFHSWRLADHPPSKGYDVLSNLIVPRPIAFVSTIGASGPNLAPFSFFVAGGPKPPSLSICIVRNKDGSKKATLANIEHHPEFVVNLLTRDMAEGMNHTGIDYPEDIQKWALSGFTGLRSEVVKPDRVSESQVQFECKLFQIVEHGGSSYVIGEVVMAHVSDKLYDEDTGIWTRFEPIARLGGAEYLDLDGGKVFEMSRPSTQPKPSLG